MGLAELFMMDALMTCRAKYVKYHQGVGGTGLRWPVEVQPLGSVTEDKGCGHKGPGRASSLRDRVFIELEPLHVSQMYALCAEQLKLMK